MEEMADLSDNSSSSHRQNGKTMEAVAHREDDGMPDAVRILVEEFEAESLEMRMKIHRLPVSLADLGDQFVIPMALAIGPYHHGLPRTQGMEKVKRVAAYTFTRHSGHSYEEMYGRVLAFEDKARRLYAVDAVSGIKPDEFADMMFHDACFLLQYMKYYSGEKQEEATCPSLQRFFLANKTCINNDIMLLENQIPWFVIQALMTDTEVVDTEVVGRFIATMGNSISGSLFSSSFDTSNIALSNPPPHLLGLLRMQKQGVPSQTNSSATQSEIDVSATPTPISAMELEGIGIKLEHSKTYNLSDMGISKGLLFDKLFLSPLILDRTRASWLANMVAFEACMTLENNYDSYICTYVAILAMLMAREEDVHKLRSKGFITGELSDKQILIFFNRLAQQMTPSLGSFEILSAIGSCKRKRWLRIMVCKFVSENAKAIAAVLSIIGVLVGIFKALYSLKQH